VLGHGLSEDGIEQPPTLAAVHGTWPPTAQKI
jgi:hypothetical protein